MSRKQNRRYNAVCIGIDGTLEENGEINDSTLISIYNLLNKHIPIVLVTGRGENGFKNFFYNISNTLINEKGLNKELIKNFIGITNDGAILFYTSEISQPMEESFKSSEMMDKSKLLISETDLEEVKKIREQMSSFLETRLVDIDFKDSKCAALNKELVSFRVIVKDEKDFGKMEEFIDYIIKSEKNRFPNSNIRYSTGKYKQKNVFQIGVGDKAKAIKKVEKFLGIPENSMLRIGDQGNETGSDFSMLNCEQGYSVDKCSESLENCYPVCDESGQLLKGVEATNYLLNTIKLFPTVCLKKPDKERYTRQLALSERNINFGKKEIIRRYNSTINEVFEIDDGFEDIFDKKSGAIVFDDWQWNLINDDNELKKLFNQKKNDSYRFLLDTDTSKILRGADTYYYFLANKVGKDVDKNLVMSWYMNYSEFFKEASSIIRNYKINSKSSDMKLLLGLLDNMRNVALINLNAAIISEYPENQSILLSFDTYLKNDEIKEWFDICNDIYTQMGMLCFKKGKFEECSNATSEILDKIIKKFPQIINKVLSKDDSNLNKRCFRTYREIDNFMENYITMNLTIERLKEENKNFLDRQINFAGLVYGGLELPLLARNILTPEQCDLDTSAVLIKKNSYDEMHSDDFFEKLIKQDLEITGERDYRKGFNIVTDDNVLTGVTLQAALELLFAKEIYIDNLSVVRYPSINRIEHMFANNRGAIDTGKFTTYIKGLIFPSPYSKIKSGESYVDELGIFNKSRDRILRYLYKNGAYAKNSEVYYIGNSEKDNEER